MKTLRLGLALPSIAIVVVGGQCAGASPRSPGSYEGGRPIVVYTALHAGSTRLRQIGLGCLHQRPPS